MLIVHSQSRNCLTQLSYEKLQKVKNNLPLKIIFKIPEDNIIFIMQPEPPTNLSIEFERLRPRRTGRHLPTYLLHNIISSYKEKVYLMGGISMLNKKHDEYHRNVFSFSTEDYMWQKDEYQIPETLRPSKPEREEIKDEGERDDGQGREDKPEDGEDEEVQKLYVRFNQSSCRIANKLYVFGGSNYQDEDFADFTVYDLENKGWEEVPVMEMSPDAMEGCAMVNVMDEYIVLYGGFNVQKLEISDKFWVYDLAIKKWKLGSGVYQKSFKYRSKPSMASVKDKIYVFGGQIESGRGEIFYMNDLTLMTCDWKNLTFTPNLVRAIDRTEPLARAFPALVNLFDRYLLLMGGEIGKDEKNEMEYSHTIEVFSLEEQVWRKIKTNAFIQRLSCFGVTQSSNDGEIYVIGMQENQGGPGLAMVKLNEEYFDGYFKVVREDFEKQCMLCPSQDEKYLNYYYLSKEFVESIVESLDFPFSAFGLLLDLSLNHHASQITFDYCQNSSPQPYFKVTTNLQLPYNYQQITKTIYNFESHHNISLSNIDKKLKQMILREYHLCEFGLLLKLAALRLGEEWVYLHFPGKGELYLWGYKLSEDDTYYICFNLKYCLKTKQVSDEEYAPLMSELQTLFKAEFEAMAKQQLHKSQKKHQKPINLLYIKRLRKVEIRDSIEPIYEIQPSTVIPFDLMNSTYKQATQTKSILTDSVDISLSSYLSMYFLKNENMKIMLAVNGKSKEVYSQMYLELIDKMVKCKVIYEMDNAFLGIDLIKTLEIYYNPDLTNVTSCFHNGILMYHRNRLITRHGCRLGDLYQKMKNSRFNQFSLFGVLEVPETVFPNMLKNDFMFSIMTQKLKTRLNHIEEQLNRHGYVLKQKVPRKTKGKDEDPQQKEKSEERPSKSEIISQQKLQIQRKSSQSPAQQNPQVSSELEEIPNEDSGNRIERDERKDERSEKNQQRNESEMVNEVEEEVVSNMESENAQLDEEGRNRSPVQNEEQLAQEQSEEKSEENEQEEQERQQREQIEQKREQQEQEQGQEQEQEKEKKQKEKKEEGKVKQNDEEEDPLKVTAKFLETPLKKIDPQQ